MADLGSLLFQRAGRIAAALWPTPLCPPLRAAQAELCRSLQLAFRLASAQRRAIVLEPTRPAGDGVLAVKLPEGVCWGRPAAVPLPPSLADSGWRGGRPRPITVMPQRRASANVWFLHHGQEALCLQLGLRGSIEVLRYRPRLRAWVNC